MKYRIISLFICLMILIVFGLHKCCLHSMAPAQDPIAQIITLLDKYFQQQTAKQNFSGTVLIAKKGKVLLKKGYGNANYELDVPNTPQIRFRMGSITKQFTAAAIMQLHEKGLLNINNTLAAYIPDFPQADTITIRHLLTHTSGIFNISTMPDIIEKAKQAITLEQEVNFIKQSAFEFAPGARHSYNNSGYVLLTYIIEKISGKSYGHYLDEHIFKPLGMRDTGVDSPIPLIKNRAAGYSKNEKGLINAPYTDMAWTAGAGELYSTVDDLYVWHNALQTASILSPESIAAMKAAQIQMGTSADEWYGYGFYHVKNTKFGLLLGHRGGTLGFKSAYYYYPDHELVIIILSNFMFTPLKESILDSIATIAVKEGA